MLTRIKKKGGVPFLAVGTRPDIRILGADFVARAGSTTYSGTTDTQPIFRNQV